MKNVLRYQPFFLFGIKQFFSNKGVLIGKACLYVVVVLIISQLWETIFSERLKAGPFSLGQIIWYVGITELMVIGDWGSYKKIGQDIRSGDICYFLIKPISYLHMLIAENLGGVFMCKLWVGVIAMICLPIFSEGYIPSTIVLGTIFFIIIFAAILSCLIRTLIGFLSFWLQETETLIFLNNKIMFVFGGGLIPLSFYPKWLQVISFCTPYSAILYGPASLVYDFSLIHILWTLFTLWIWIVLIGALLVLTFKKGQKRLEINGG